MKRPTKQSATAHREKEKTSKRRVADAVMRLSESGISETQRNLLQMALPALNKMMLQNYEHAAKMSDEDILISLSKYLSLLESRSIVNKLHSRKRSTSAFRPVFPCCSKFPGLPFCNSKC